MSHALLIGALLAVGPVPEGKTDEQLKQAALKLNDAGTLEAAFDAADKLLRPKADARRLAKLAAKMQKDADKPPLKFNAALALARVGVIVKEYDAAESLYESCEAVARGVSSPTKLLEVRAGQIDLFWDQKKWAEADGAVKAAVEVREKTLGNDGAGLLQLVGLYEKLIQVQGLLGETDRGVKLADDLRAKFPVEPLRPLFLTPKAAILAEAGKPAEAVKVVNQFLEEADKLNEVFNKPEVAESYKRAARYRLSGYLVDADQVPEAVKILRKLLDDNPQSPTFHNDLGFVLADHDLELEEAEKLCRKAVELDLAGRKKLLEAGELDADAAKKETSAYIDSLGWALFKRGKYAEALPLLEKASKDEDDGNHLELWDHWADCLMKLDQKDKAIATWEKALTFADISRRDVERRKAVSGKLKAAKQK